MLTVLNKFKAGDALMILMQTQKIREFKDFNELVNETEFKTQYRLTEQRIAEIVDTKNRMNRPPTITPVSVPVEKKAEHDDYFKAMKKIEQQSKATELSEEQAEEVNKLKLQEVRKFQ